MVFQHGSNAAPGNFVGRVGAFLAELTFQLVGYGSYLMPALITSWPWHYFWCRGIDAIYTKLVGASLALSSTSAFMSLALGSIDVGARPFRAGGYLGDFVAGSMAEYLSRMGSIIVILTLLVVAVILATQFSFGRLFSLIFAAVGAALAPRWASFRATVDERRKAKQRLEVIAKHVKKGTASAEVLKAATERGARPETAAPRPRGAPVRRAAEEEEDDEKWRRAGRRPRLRRRHRPSCRSAAASRR